MKSPSDENVERHLTELARKMDYPATPDVRPAVRRGARPRRLAGIPAGLLWGAAVLVALVAVVFAVPAARAEVLRFFRIGAVQIFPVTPTGQPRPGSIDSFPRLDGLTTLEAARRRASFDVLLPSYPDELGEPDRVYLQSDGPVVVLLWLDPTDPGVIRVSLQEIGPGSLTVRKFAPVAVEETQVNGARAIWAQGPYLLQLEDGNYSALELVRGNVLVWSAKGITYRLECGAALDEAVKIAESLR